MLLVLIPLFALTMILAGVIMVWPRVTRHMSGRVVAFLGIFILPVVSLLGGLGDHMTRSKSTEFCISCHVMEPYYESLFIDEGRHLPAIHYQNRTIPRDKACFTCHTNYTMFGDMKAKMNGLKHLWVYYFEDIPDKIELYAPYNNRECLHCHRDSRAFEEHPQHVKARERLEDGELRCFACHFKKHGVHDDLQRAPKWTPKGGAK